MSRPPDIEDTSSGEEVDSEPRRRWKPNADLLRALADARKDLKPGESSLFWDWTATREAAPEAEDVRPSGEGEVFVHEKDAAAAYIAPVQVAPAVPPRQCTKSRIRVREDVDPRRQPTVRTARNVGDCVPQWTPRDSRQSAMGSPRDSRASVPCVPDSSRPVATFRDASDAPPSWRDGRRSSQLVSPRNGERSRSPSWPDTTTPSCAPPSTRTGDRPAFMPIPDGGGPGPDRRRRVALAILVGVLSGTLAFFWLRVSPEKTGTVAPDSAVPVCPGGDGEATPLHPPAMTCVPMSTSGQTTAPPASTSQSGAPTGANDSGAPIGMNDAIFGDPGGAPRDSGSPATSPGTGSGPGAGAPRPGGAASSGSGPANEKPHGGPTATPNTVPAGAPGNVGTASPGGGRSAPTSQGGGGFFVRKKGSK